MKGKKLKLVILVKYFYPLKIVSGNIGFYKQLLPELSKFVDLHVVTYNKARVDSCESYQGYAIHRVGCPFFLKGPLIARKLKPDMIIFGTGIWRNTEHLLISSLIRLLTLGNKLILQQNVCFELKKPFFLTLLGYIFDGILCLGPAVYEQFSKYSRKTYLLPPGINVDNLKNLKKIEKKCKLRIGFFGQYIAHKSPEDLIDCFLRINPKDAELFMAAQKVKGLFVNKYKEKFIEPKVRGKRNIVMKEYVDDIYSVINSCDIVVVPFKVDYGTLGLAQTAVDAMALGKPVIGYDSATIKPLINHGKDGYLYKNKEDLRKYLAALISNAKLRVLIGNKARKKILTEYNIKKTVEGMYSFITKI